MPASSSNVLLLSDGSYFCLSDGSYLRLMG